MCVGYLLSTVFLIIARTSKRFLLPKTDTDLDQQSSALFGIIEFARINYWI